MLLIAKLSIVVRYSLPDLWHVQSKTAHRSFQEKVSKKSLLKYKFSISQLDCTLQLRLQSCLRGFIIGIILKAKQDSLSSAAYTNYIPYNDLVVVRCIYTITVNVRRNPCVTAIQPCTCNGIFLHICGMLTRPTYYTTAYMQFLNFHELFGLQQIFRYPFTRQEPQFIDYSADLRFSVKSPKPITAFRIRNK